MIRKEQNLTLRKDNLAVAEVVEESVGLELKICKTTKSKILNNLTCLETSWTNNRKKLHRTRSVSEAARLKPKLWREGVLETANLKKRKKTKS